MVPRQVGQPLECSSYLRPPSNAISINITTIIITLLLRAFRCTRKSARVPFWQTQHPTPSNPTANRLKGYP